MYRKIINLPYAEYEDDFEESLSFIKKSKCLSQELLKYIKSKEENKKFWVKAYMKTQFCCGICTTSRIEAKHRIFKQYLNSGRKLTELFLVVKELEEKEISSLKNEIEKSKRLARKQQEKSDLIKHFKKDYSEYIITRLKDNLIESTNYKIIRENEKLW